MFHQRRYQIKTISERYKSSDEGVKNIKKKKKKTNKKASLDIESEFWELAYSLSELKKKSFGFMKEVSNQKPTPKKFCYITH